LSEKNASLIAQANWRGDERKKERNWEYKSRGNHMEEVMVEGSRRETERNDGRRQKDDDTSPFYPRWLRMILERY
jgi:hypothetical protein